jgi:hypothetical protein
MMANKATQHSAHCNTHLRPSYMDPHSNVDSNPTMTHTRPQHTPRHQWTMLGSQPLSPPKSKPLSLQLYSMCVGQLSPGEVQYSCSTLCVFKYRSTCIACRTPTGYQYHSRVHWLGVLQSCDKGSKFGPGSTHHHPRWECS